MDSEQTFTFSNPYISHRYTLMFGTPTFKIDRVCSTTESPRKVEAYGFIRSGIDFYDGSEPLILNQGTTNVFLDEITDLSSCFIPVPGRSSHRNPINDDQKLRKEMIEILEEKFPGYVMHADVVVFTNLEGFNIFNNRFDPGATYKPFLLEWARDLRIPERTLFSREGAE